MVRRKLRSLALCACFALPAGFASAGGSDIEGRDEDDHGGRIFGEVKDIKGLRPLEGARISAQMKGTPLPVIAATDEDGRFRFPGFGKGVDTETVDVTCAMRGYRVVSLDRRKIGRAADAPLEIECLLEKQ